MSFDNHDKEDSNGVKYYRPLKTSGLDEKSKQKGMQIKCYTEAHSKTLTGFFKWFDDNGYEITAK